MKRVEGQAKFGAVAILAMAAYHNSGGWDQDLITRTIGANVVILANTTIMTSAILVSAPFNTANNLGSLKWKFATGNIVESSPTIGSDGTIYFGSDDGNVYAVDPYGNQKWKFTTQNNSFVRTAPSDWPTDGIIYFGAEGGRSYGSIYALNPDGSEKWFSLLEFNVDSSPAIGSDGSIYFGDAGAAVVALNSSRQ